MKYTDDEIKNIIDLYKNGNNTVQVALITKKSQTGIERLLKSLGLYVKRTSLTITSADSINDIIDMYVNKRISTVKIGLKYHVSDNTIASVLKRAGVSVTKKRCRTVINSSYFEKIDSERKAYFLGLIIADGSIIRGRTNCKAFALSLVEQDDYVIRDLSYEISGGFLRTYKTLFSYRQNMTTLKFSDAEFISNLEKLGVVPCKTEHTFFPDIPEHLMRHFIRGYFDGDGCICFTKNKLVVSFVGSKDLIPEVFKKLFDAKVIQRIPAITDRGNFCSSSFSKRQSIINFYNYLYKDSSIYLTRKRDKFTGVLGSNV